MATALVSYLEMNTPPARERAIPPREGLMVLREWEIDIDFYLDLQKKIGADYHWLERLEMPRDVVQELIHTPGVEIYLLFCGGVCAGFAEIDARQQPTVELKFFGLLPDFIGRGLGTYFLSEVIDLAWQHKPHRIWLHTDTNDHPRALGNYQKAGFNVYKQEIERISLYADSSALSAVSIF